MGERLDDNLLEAAAHGLRSSARGHLRLLRGAADAGPFEEAYAATYSSGAEGDILKTISQFSSLLSVIAASGRNGGDNRTGSYLAHVPELQSYAVQEIVASALQLASQTKLEDAKFIEALEFMNTRLGQVNSKFGYPVARRIILGTLLKKRLDYGSAFPAAVQKSVDKVMLQLFALHKRSAAAKGIVQFLHISKSGGTNLCGTAASNGCTSEGFDEKHNCLVKEFNDIPRWVTYNAHK